MEKYDAIIIGAGLGGLTAGAKLAKEGKKVLLIEQHTIPGGCATTFKRKDFTIEVGLHETGGLDKDNPKVKIFEELEIFENVEFLRVPEFYRFKSEKYDLVIPDDRQQAINTLVQHFPDEEKGVKKFFKVIFAIGGEINRLLQVRWKRIALFPLFPLLFPNLVFRTKQTVGDFLDKTIKNQDLKLVLVANLTYYHDNPYTMSLIYFAGAQAEFYHGGYYIKGGSQKLSDHLMHFIEKKGGKVILRHLVTRILTENGKAIGVEYKETKSKTDETQKAFAIYIIANAAVPNVANQLLIEKESEKLHKKIQGLEIACSLISVYFGFRKPLKELGNKHYSTFVFDKEVLSLEDMHANYKGDWSKRNFVFCDYSQLDSGLAPQGKSVGVICTSDYVSDWDKLSREDYKARKEEVAQIFIERIEKLIPGIRDAIEYYEVATAKTIQRYTLNPDGSPYGFAQTPDQALFNRVQIKSPIKNLYFASAWSMPGGGFTGAILGGYFCAKEIL